MHILNRLKKSFSFRYKHWLKKKDVRKKKVAVAKHNKKIGKISIRDFTIISSNCWGGSVYEDLKLPYQSPTIGLFFYAPCYIELLQNLTTNINLPLRFISKSKYKEANACRNQKYTYPIGLLGDAIEIHFLHYKSEEEARDKWERRRQRINWDNLFISCTDRDKMTFKLMQDFDNLPFKKKVLFTGKTYTHINSAVFLKAFKKKGMVGDLYNQRYLVTKDFKLKKWLDQ